MVTNQEISKLNYPIWESIYNKNSISKINLSNINLSNTETIQIVINNIKSFIFPRFNQKESSFLYKKYYKFTFETEIFEEIQCMYNIFNPIYDEETSIVYLFSFQNQFEEYIKIIEFNIKTEELRILRSSGIFPDAGLLNNGIFWFKNQKIYVGSHENKEIYTFCSIAYEWNIERQINSNISDMLSNSSSYFMSFYLQKRVLLIENLNNKKGFNIFELDQFNNKLNKLKFFNYENSSFTMILSMICMSSNNYNMILFYLYDSFFVFDLHTNEILQLKHLINHPHFPHISHIPHLHIPSCLSYINIENLILIPNYKQSKLYLVTFTSSSLSSDSMSLSVDIYKTSNTYIQSNNSFEYINHYRSYSKEDNNFSYLLNNKPSSDYLIHFSDKSKQKDIYLDKRVLESLSFEVKSIVKEKENKSTTVISSKKVNSSKQQIMEMYFSNTSPIGASNLILLIYSNFNETHLKAITIDVYDEIFLFLKQFSAENTILKLCFLMKNILSNENCLGLYDISIKYNLQLLNELCKVYISNRISESCVLNDEGNSLSEGIDAFFSICHQKIYDFKYISKEMLLRNFCLHRNMVISAETSLVNVEICQSNSFRDRICSIINDNSNRLFNKVDIGNNLQVMKMRICLECNSIIR